ATVVLESGATERPLARGATELAPGSYTVVASAPGRATVRMPLRLGPGDHEGLAWTLPPAAAIPQGFIYIPPGRFLYGSRDDEGVRVFFRNSPMHERFTEAFLIARTEVTYAQWIEFLEDLPAVDRARRRPHTGDGSSLQKGYVDLRQIGATWELTIA